ncbi:MAG: hypothetical protein K6G28_06550 [Acholeplasmatales bacterium]|nr:hypothetical protein [Acholeplasmatales bacterium]
MENIDEKIKKLMQKEIHAKTVLIDKADLEERIKQEEAEGFKFIKSTEINGRLKVTFEK